MTATGESCNIVPTLPLTKRLIRHGNSVGIIIDQAVLKQVGWAQDMEVEIRVDGRTIVLLPVAKKGKKLETR